MGYKKSSSSCSSRISYNGAHKIIIKYWRSHFENFRALSKQKTHLHWIYPCRLLKTFKVTIHEKSCPLQSSFFLRLKNTSQAKGFQRRFPEKYKSVCNYRYRARCCPKYRCRDHESQRPQACREDEQHKGDLVGNWKQYLPQLDPLYKWAGVVSKRRVRCSCAYWPYNDPVLLQVQQTHEKCDEHVKHCFFPPISDKWLLKRSFFQMTLQQNIL